jgi:hypothetical protein
MRLRPDDTGRRVRPGRRRFNAHGSERWSARRSGTEDRHRREWQRRRHRRCARRGARQRLRLSGTDAFDTGRSRPGQSASKLLHGADRRRLLVLPLRTRQRIARQLPARRSHSRLHDRLLQRLLRLRRTIRPILLDSFSRPEDGRRTRTTNRCWGAKQLERSGRAPVLHLS